MDKKEKGRYYDDQEEESLTVEELQEMLTIARQEMMKSQEETKELTQTLATTIPRSQALQVRRELEAKIEELTSEAQHLKDAVDSERKEREWLEEELRTQYKAAAQTDQEMKNLQEFVKKLHTLLEEKGKSIEGQKDEREATLRLLEETKEEVSRLKKEGSSKARLLTRLEETQREILAISKAKDEELINYQKDAIATKRQYDQLHKDLRRQNERKAELEHQFKLARGQVKVVSEQVKVRQRQERSAKRHIEKISREKQGLQRNFLRAAAEEKKQKSLVSLGDKDKDKTQKLMLKNLLDLHQQEKLISQLQDARDRQMEETARVESKVVDLAGEVEVRDKDIEDLLRRQAVLKANLGKTVLVFDALKRENYSIARHLALVKTEKEEEREKLRIKSFTTEKLGDICKSKDGKIVSLSADAEERKVTELKLRGKMAELRNEIGAQELSLKILEGEKSDLQRVLEEHELVLEGIKGSLEEKENERALESTTLCRRNDEISALQNRVNLLEHILRRGNKEYDARLKEIRLLKTELAAVREERDILLHQVGLVKSLKVELSRQQKLLVSTQKEKSVLERNAINKKAVIHRWTALQASNPDTFELLQKNKIFQKRILVSTERITSLECEVSQKEKENEELRRLLERSSSYFRDGHQTQSIRLHLQNQLKLKEEQLKSVTAALNSAVLKQEDSEQEKKNLKSKIENLTWKTTQLQKKLQKLQKQN